MRVPAMIAHVLLIVLLIVLLTVLAPAAASAQWDRPAQLAGTWYPGDPATLSQRLDRYLAGPGQTQAGGRVTAPVTALVVPHAGYTYSGRVAAAAWRLAGRITPPVKTVVLLGPSHRYPLQRPSIWPQGSYQTPLGPVPVDAALATELTRALDAGFERQAHMSEHCLEIQAPFIRKVLPQAKMVAILTGPPDAALAKKMGRALAQAIKGKPVLLVASTDLSHFHSQKTAEVLDRRVARRVSGLDPEGLWHEASAGKSEACGLMALMTVLYAARDLGARQGVVLEQSTSAAVTGDLKSVVGYLAAALVGPDESSGAGRKDGGLSDARKSLLRDLAWQSVRATVTGREPPQPPADQAWLQENGRVFVTLRRHGRLRGCIGNPMGGRSLGDAVVAMAAAAASQDPRFTPVRAQELDSLELEISVLTEPRPTTADAVRVGTDGLLIRRGPRGGLLLPQVPQEQGWNREQFLEGVCQKAGLPSGAWREPDCRLYSFQAMVF